MIENLPRHVNVVFVITVLVTFGFIYYALVLRESKAKSLIPVKTMMFIGAWLVLLTILSSNFFFLNFDSPRLLIALGLPVLMILYLFINKQARAIILDLPITTLTYIHTVRIPVEIVLWWLFSVNMIPELMTFNGRNYDILVGISAPFVGYFALGKIIKSNVGALLWNGLSLLSLLNIVINAILSTPYDFQVQAFEQPNKAVFYFPFILLPGFIVPAVFFSHLASIYILLKKDIHSELADLEL